MPRGIPLKDSAGLVPEPSHVFAAGMMPFWENAGLMIRISSADVKAPRPADGRSDNERGTPQHTGIRFATELRDVRGQDDEDRIPASQSQGETRHNKRRRDVNGRSIEATVHRVAFAQSKKTRRSRHAGLRPQRAARAYRIETDVHGKYKPIENAAAIQNLFNLISKSDSELVTKGTPEVAGIHPDK